MHPVPLKPLAFMRRLAPPAQALALAISIGLFGTPALADADGPDAWRVVDVAADDSLNLRMGPATVWPVIGIFGPNARGLQNITCVPLVSDGEWFAMTDAQRSKLPQRWCLVRASDNDQTGWVAARYLTEDTATAPLPTPTPTPTATAAAPADADNDSGCAAPTRTGGTANTSAPLWQQIQADSDEFTGAPGYQPLDLSPGSSAIDWDVVYTPERFPDAGQSALLPDADMGAVARAMLVFDAAEGVIPHPRYHVTYHLHQVFDDCDIIPRAYVQITRYNLGAARYQDVIQYADKPYWPPKDIFGPGPHVSWRLAMGPVQGKYADIFQASRRELDDRAAATADCLGQSCLALQHATGPDGNWQQLQPSALPAPVYKEPGYAWAPGPVRVAEMLYAQAAGSAQNIEASEGTSFDRPDMTLVISRDVDGQDSNTHGLLQWQGLMDDAIGQEWLRLQAVPGSPPQWQAHTVYRRGGA